MTEKFRKSRKSGIIPAIALAAGLVASVAFAAGPMWVTGAGAELKAEPNPGSGTLKTLQVGEELSIGEASGRWLKATAQGGQSGWVYKGKVSDQKPSGGESKGDPFGGMLASKVSSNSADTSRSIRGLSPEAEQYANQTGSPVENRKALDHVVALHPTPQEVAKFLKDGKVGEYAQ